MRMLFGWQIKWWRVNGSQTYWYNKCHYKFQCYIHADMILRLMQLEYVEHKKKENCRTQTQTHITDIKI